jgi:hypothetical protein
MEALDIPRPRLVVTYSSSALMGRELAERHRAKLDGVFFLDPYMPEALLTEERWRIEKLKASTKWGLGQTGHQSRDRVFRERR